MLTSIRFFIKFFFLLFFLSGCGFVERKLSYFGVGPCVNSYEKSSYNGHAKLGSTYTIKDKSYTPETNPSYEEEGLASWYGDDFHCNHTANGEKFNKWQLSAAHRTLPMPSIAEVTNLKNGKRIKVVINDRGPFTSTKRIIDVSEHAAEKLGFKNNGLTHVKVRFLPQETKELVAKLNLPEHIFFANGKAHYKPKSYLENENSSISKLEQAENRVHTKRQTQSSNESIFQDPNYKLVATIANKRKAVNMATKLSRHGNVRIDKDPKTTKEYQIFFSAAKGKKANLKEIKKILSTN
jgi:rare lipoprotein A